MSSAHRVQVNKEGVLLERTDKEFVNSYELQVVGDPRIFKREPNQPCAVLWPGVSLKKMVIEIKPENSRIK